MVGNVTSRIRSFLLNIAKYLRSCNVVLNSFHYSEVDEKVINSSKQFKNFEKFVCFFFSNFIADIMN